MTAFNFSILIQIASWKNLGQIIFLKCFLIVFNTWCVFVCLSTSNKGGTHTHLHGKRNSAIDLLIYFFLVYCIIVFPNSFQTQASWKELALWRPPPGVLFYFFYAIFGYLLWFVLWLLLLPRMIWLRMTYAKWVGPFTMVIQGWSFDGQRVANNWHGENRDVHCQLRESRRGQERVVNVLSQRNSQADNISDKWFLSQPQPQHKVLNKKKEIITFSKLCNFFLCFVWIKR